MYWDQPVTVFALSALVLSAIHGGLAAPTPDDFTFVAHETVIPIVIDTALDSHITAVVPTGTATGANPATTSSPKEQQDGVNITTIVVPLGTASGENPATTYLYQEIQEYPQRAAAHLGTTFAAETVTALGTLVASAPGYMLSAVMHGAGGDMNVDIECRYINSAEEECVMNAGLNGPYTTIGRFYSPHPQMPSESDMATARATPVPTTVLD
jgi:hypothetical protein